MGDNLNEFGERGISHITEYVKSGKKTNFRVLDYDELKQFFDKNKTKINDGSDDYKLAIIQATYNGKIPKINIANLDKLYLKAIKLNPVLGNTHQEFYLVNVLDIADEEGKMGNILIPKYSELEAKCILYNLPFIESLLPLTLYSEEWHSKVLDDAIIFNVSESTLAIPREEIYSLLSKLNPIFEERKVYGFLAGISNDPKLEIRYNKREDGSYNIPKSLQHIFYTPGSETSKKIIGRPDIDEILEGDLSLIEKTMGLLRNNEKITLSLHNRLFIGEPGTGKTTAVRYFAEKAMKLGVPVFDLGRGINGDSNSNLAAMISKALDILGIYATYSKTPVLVVWDDITEILKTNSKSDLDRDDLSSTIKRAIGGIDNNPLLMIYATGNIEYINSAFTTPKRFGKPILLESTPDIQTEMIYQSIGNYRLRDFPENKEILLSLLNSLPPLSNEVIMSILEITSEKNDSPSYTDFENEITRYIIGTSQEQTMTKIEKEHRARYVAGILTVAISLNHPPYAAKTEPTTELDMPEVFFSLDSDVRKEDILYFLSVCGSQAAFELVDDKESTLNSSIRQYAESTTSRGATHLIDFSSTSHMGIDTFNISRRDKDRDISTWVYENTQKFGVNFAKKVITENMVFFNRIYEILLNTPVLYPKDIAQIDSSDIITSNIPNDFFEEATSTIYYGPAKNYTAPAGFVPKPK